MKQVVTKKIDKRTLEVIFSDQLDDLNSKRNAVLCERKEILQVDLKSPLAQVVIGVRRSGKSTLCFQALEKSGAKYGYADFNDERLAGIGSDQLNDVLEILYKLNGNFEYLFLDEIQDVKGWHLFVNRMLRKGMHVVLTGSNANLLSSELATYLTGRNKEIDLYPFSFSEYCRMKNVDTSSLSTKAEAFRRAAFDEYMKEGGFPEKMFIEDNGSYVDDLVNNILKRDIEQRHNITYVDAFERMANHLLNISPATVSVPDLTELFEFKSAVTVRNYIKYLKEAFILIEVQKFSTKSRQRVSQEKVYAVDVAMMDGRKNAFSGDNLGWRLETVVLIELKRRSAADRSDIYYLKDRSSECDFLICKKDSVLQAVQVSYDISAEKTRKRELKGLTFAAKKTGCKDLLLLTDHVYENVDVDGLQIKIRPVYNWCLGID